MSLYFAQRYSYEPTRYRVKDAMSESSVGGMSAIQNMEVVTAHSYDELRRAYDHAYDGLILALREKV